MVPIREPIIETAPIEAQPEPVAEPEPVPEPEPVAEPEPVPEPAVAAPQAPVEPPLPDPSDRFELHEVDVPPVPLSTRLPVYRPDDPEAAGEGTVRMRVLVGGHGRISSVRVIDEISGSEMQRAALNAVLRWRFSGGSHRGVPVHVWVPVQLDFQEAGDGTRSVVISEY
jgi:TonB family protein